MSRPPPTPQPSAEPVAPDSMREAFEHWVATQCNDCTNYSVWKAACSWAAQQVQPAPAAPQAAPFTLAMTAEQVQSLYITLTRARTGGKKEPETRPAWGWMEQPLIDIEKALEPLHGAIHDRQFNAMNRQFFGDDSRRLPEAELAPDVSATAPQAAQPQPPAFEQMQALAKDMGERFGIFMSLPTAQAMLHNALSAAAAQAAPPGGQS